MRLERIANNNLKTNKELNNKGVSLKLGDKISAKVIDIDGKNVKLQVGSDIIDAINEGSKQLYKGMNSNFDVVSVTDGRIEIKASLLSFLSSDKDNIDFLSQKLASLNIHENQDNLSILETMFLNSNMLSKSNFLKIKTSLLKTEQILNSLSNVDINNLSLEEFSEISDLKILNLELSKNLKDNLISELGEKLKEFSNTKDNIKDAIIQNEKTENITTKTKTNTISLENQKEDTSEKILNSKKQEATINNQINKDSNIVDFAKSESLKLEKNLVQNFIKLASNKEELVKEVSFLMKNDISINPFNLTLSSNLLKGNIGFIEQIAENILNKNIAADDNLVSSIVELLDKSLETNSDELSVDDLVKELVDNKEKIEIIKEALKREINSNSKPESKIKLIENSFKFLNKLDDNWNTNFVPFIEKAKIRDVEIFVKKDSKRNSISKSKDKLVYIALDTENLARVKVKLDYKKNGVNLVFLLENKEIADFFSKKVEELSQRLDYSQDKKVNISVNVDEKNLALKDFELASNNAITGIDITV